MAAIGTAVLGKSFGRSSVEKAFRPLIDRVEDFFSYILLIIREVGKHNNGIFHSKDGGDHKMTFFVMCKMFFINF